MNPFSWECPHCCQTVTITDSDIRRDLSRAHWAKSEGPRVLWISWLHCPNPKCLKLTLSATLYLGDLKNGELTPIGDALERWSLLPRSQTISLPKYIPNGIRADYEEACLIRDLSPKASATLSRRCLQGILRDYWSVKAGRLVDEIMEIKDKTDHETWEAIEAVRKVGNIGAHMEKDINTIVDVDPEEAGLLIQLLEMLFRDWYIARERKRERLAAIKLVAEDKEKQKKGIAKSPVISSPAKD